MVIHILFALIHQHPTSNCRTSQQRTRFHIRLPKSIIIFTAFLYLHTVVSFPLINRISFFALFQFDFPFLIYRSLVFYIHNNTQAHRTTIQRLTFTAFTTKVCLLCVYCSRLFSFIYFTLLVHIFCFLLLCVLNHRGEGLPAVNWSSVD